MQIYWCHLQWARQHSLDQWVLSQGQSQWCIAEWRHSTQLGLQIFICYWYCQGNVIYALKENLSWETDLLQLHYWWQMDSEDLWCVSFSHTCTILFCKAPLHGSLALNKYSLIKHPNRHSGANCFASHSPPLKDSITYDVAIVIANVTNRESLNCHRIHISLLRV